MLNVIHKQLTKCKRRLTLRNLWLAIVQQFNVYKIGPEIKIAGVDLSLQMRAYLWLLAH